MKKKKLFILLFILIGNLSFGQNNFTYFLGIQPSITKEKFYESNEFDINIVPLVFQFPVSKRIDIRGTSLFNFHFGDESGMSDIGLELAAPVFLKKKENRSYRSYGFYISPVIGFGRNFINEHNTLTLAAEPGYLFKAKKKFTVNLMLQLGGSYFRYAENVDVWRQHFGFKVNLGFWDLFK